MSNPGLSQTTQRQPSRLVGAQSGERICYETLRDILRRRAKLAGIPMSSLHDFRRAFALEMLRNGADIFALINNGHGRSTNSD